MITQLRSNQLLEEGVEGGEKTTSGKPLELVRGRGSRLRVGEKLATS